MDHLSELNLLTATQAGFFVCVVTLFLGCVTGTAINLKKSMQ